jgi:hypothetical protein
MKKKDMKSLLKKLKKVKVRLGRLGVPPEGFGRREPGTGPRAQAGVCIGLNKGVAQEDIMEGFDRRAAEAIGDWIDVLEKVDGELVQLAGELRRFKMGADPDLKGIRGHFKGMRNSSLQLLRTISKP